jgi:hypothetical protein
MLQVRRNASTHLMWVLWTCASSWRRHTLQGWEEISLTISKGSALHLAIWTNASTSGPYTCFNTSSVDVVRLCLVMEEAYFAALGRNFLDLQGLGSSSGHLDQRICFGSIDMLRHILCGCCELLPRHGGGIRCRFRKGFPWPSSWSRLFSWPSPILEVHHIGFSDVLSLIPGIAVAIQQSFSIALRLLI